jgi:hypothetical protein
MQTFKASEIMQVGIRIEENGEKLYRHARNVADDPKTKDFFGFLAGEEARHKKVFQDWLAKAVPSDPPETYPGEYVAYLRAYADQIVFPADVMDSGGESSAGRLKAMMDLMLDNPKVTVAFCCRYAGLTRSDAWEARDGAGRPLSASTRA